MIHLEFRASGAMLGGHEGKRMHRFDQAITKFSWGAIATGITLSVLGDVGGAIAQMRPTTTEKLSTNAPVLLSQRFECRQVAPSQGTPFYSALPQQQRPPYSYLPRGSRVSVDITSTATRAPDGRFYQFVTSPYNGRNTVTGYIPVQFQAQTGQFRNTLEPCRRRMW